MKVVEYKVVGMTCSGCENSVKRVVSRVEGVESVDANHSENKVVVTYQDDKASDDVVLNKITKLGYQAEVKS